ncbi:MAG: response regulator transcription factor [Clostridiales bacterium]|nr:response regulator transcription factor [Clostridiales bacterium]HBM80282.1 DNA-binding response regulator [Clostridiaceae bacterium]
MSKNIMIVEDEYRMRHLLSDYFRKEGYSIVEAEDGKEALEKFKEDIDVIILDIMLPNLDGWTVCKAIRNSSNVPIIMLTAKSEEDDKLLGYELGADDYVTKPFSPKVLVAKVKALIKRTEILTGNTDGITESSGIRIDENAHDVTVDGRPVNLAPKEYDLLLYLMRNKSVALAREKILDNIWGYDYYGDFRTVDTHIKRLREKLGDKGELICTVRGSGYKFEAKDEKK